MSAIAPTVDRPAPPSEGILVRLCERGWIPDALVRFGIRRLCAARLRDEQAGGIEAVAERQRLRIAGLHGSAIAIETDAAFLPARVDARDEVALDTGSLLVVVLLFVKVGDVLEGSLVLEACVYPCKLE